MMNYTTKDVIRFWKKVNIPNPPINCWEWTGELKDGYGRFYSPSRRFYSHRFSYEFFSGQISIGLVICHSCDNRKCCNPDHLFIGTQADNMADMVKKGRQARGERTGTHVLTQNQVNYIRERYSLGDISQKQLASELGVHAKTISKIIRFMRWKAN